MRFVILATAMLMPLSLKAGTLDQAYNKSASIKAICDAYDANEFAADRQYKGQLFNLGGEVYEVSKSEGDIPLLELKVPPGSKIYLVKCYFDNSAGIEKVKAGSTVALRGIVDGKRDSYVIVKHCVLVR